MSYDDGREYDRQLVEIFNKYGVKGTFHLNAGVLGADRYITKEEVPTLFAGHEVSSHMLTHPFPDRLPQIEVIHECLKDRAELERLCGYIVRGMSYPFGRYSPEAINALKTCGIEYSRTTENGGFGLPSDFMLWHPTCHHSANIIEKLKDFEGNRWSPMGLFYIWGHSYEFPQAEGSWEMMDEFCKRASESESDFWFATNIEIVDYVNALRALRFSADKTIVYNPTAIDVWIGVDYQPVKIPAGQTVKL